MTIFGYGGPAKELRRLNHTTTETVSYVDRNPEAEAVETRYDQALREGYEAGYSDGLEKAAIEALAIREQESYRAETALKALSAALGSANQVQNQLLGEIQVTVPRLAFAVVEQLLARELEVSTNPGREAIQRALTLDQGSQPATVRMSPRDVETLGDISDLRLLREISVIADSSIVPGGVLVEIDRSVIDAQIDTALARIKRVLFGYESGAST